MPRKTAEELDRVTAQTESNNRDFDAQGRPVTSPKGARFAMQVMPATARDPGFGLKPANPNDADDMNRLGRQYRAKMEERYGGDYSKMWAAYNAGPGRVDAAISKHGSNWLNHMPEETRNYVRKNLNSSGGGGSGGGESAGRAALAPSRVSKILDSDHTVVIDAEEPGEPYTGETGVISESGIEAIDPNDAINSGVFKTTRNNPVINPNAVGPELRSRADRVEAEIAGQEAFIRRQENEVQQVQDTRRERTERIVEEKRGILKVMQEGNKALRERVAPLLGRKDQVDNRRAELAQMNPLEKGLRGIFDLNYNENYLDEVSGDLGNAVKSVSDNYQHITTLQEQYINQINAEDANEGQLEALKLTELDEDGKLMAQSLNQAVTSFDFLGKQVASNSNTIRAQILARSAYLDEMDAGQIGKLLEEAKKSEDGTIQSNGMTLNVGELKQRAVSWEKVALGLRSAEISVAAGEMNLADSHAREVASRMTEAQLQEAAANNGMYRGVQFPTDAITAGLAAHAQQQGIRAQALLQDGAAGDVNSMAKGLIGRFRSSAEKIREMHGMDGKKLPASFDRHAASIMNRLRDAINKQNEANKAGLGDTVGQEIGKQIIGLQQEYESALSDLALKYTGGDKETAGLVEAYFNGDPINSAQSAKAMQGFVEQGGLPTNMKTSPVFTKMYETAVAATNRVDASIASSGQKVNKAKRAEMIRREITRAAPKVVNQSNMRQIFPMLPAMAKQAGHSFGQVSQEDLLVSQQKGTQAGWQFASDSLGVSVPDAKAFFGGRSPRGMEAGQAQQLIEQAKGLKAEMISTQRAAMLSALDSSPSAKDGFRPSKALVDFTNSNGFYQSVDRFQGMQSNFSFGDKIASAMGDGGLVNQAASLGSSLRSISQSMEIEQRSGTDLALANYTVNPGQRTTAVLAAIPGLQPADEQALLQVLKREIPGFTESRLTGKTEFNAGIRDYIMTAKFQDPKLERIRQIAAKDWDATAQQTDAMINSMRNPVERMIYGDQAD